MPISRILLAISCAASVYCVMISLAEAQRHGGNRRAVSAAAAEFRDMFKLRGSVAPWENRSLAKSRSESQRLMAREKIV